MFDIAIIGAGPGAIPQPTRLPVEANRLFSLSAISLAVPALTAVAYQQKLCFTHPKPSLKQTAEVNMASYVRVWRWTFLPCMRTRQKS